MKNKLRGTAIVINMSIILLTIQNINLLKAQQWVFKTYTFPSCYTQSNGFCVINNKAYIGVGTFYCHDWWEFDPINNTTIQKASFPNSDSTGSYPTCFSINGNGYLMSATGRFYKYDPIADNWTQKTSFPINFPNGDSLNETHNSTFVLNGKGYVVGYEVRTIDYTYSRNSFDVFEYDPINDTWQNKGPTPDSAYGFTGFTINNSGYIIGGDRFMTSTLPLTGNTLYEYNPLNNSWTKKTSCPIFKILSRGFVIGTKFYYGTGINYNLNTGSMYQNADIFYSYDQPTDSWQHLAPLPDSTMWDEGVGFAINGKGYLGLGDCFSFNGEASPPPIPPCSPGFYNTIWEYDPTVSGINENFKNNIVSIFPNPFSSQTTLKILDNFKNATLTIYSSYGQQVKQIKNINGQTVILSRDNVASGLYFVRLTEENKIIAVDKLVINDK